MNIRIAAIAAAAAAAALSTASIAADPPAGSNGKAVGRADTVHCYGVNTCRGTADCRTTAHDCRGMNDCAGHGFKAMTAEACLTGGGTIGDIN